MLSHINKLYSVLSGTIRVCLLNSELTWEHNYRAHHDKGALLGDPILDPAFGIVTFAGHMCLFVCVCS